MSVLLMVTRLSSATSLDLVLLSSISSWRKESMKYHGMQPSLQAKAMSIFPILQESSYFDQVSLLAKEFV